MVQPRTRPKEKRQNTGALQGGTESSEVRSLTVPHKLPPAVRAHKGPLDKTRHHQLGRDTRAHATEASTAEGNSLRGIVLTALAGACGNRTHQGLLSRPQLVLKTSQTTRPDPPPS